MTLDEFNEKWNGIVTHGHWGEYIEDFFDMYETEGFCETFESYYEQYKAHNGQRYEIIRRCTTDDGWDLESLPAWKIRLEDGAIIDAFPEEICKVER